MDPEEQIPATFWKIKRKTIKKPAQSAKKIVTTKVDVLKILGGHFERDENDVIRCTIEDCQGTVARWQSYYFKRHFITKHPKRLLELIPGAIDLDRLCKIEVCEQTYNAIELVAVHGQPAHILDTPAIQGFLRKQVEQLEENGYKLTLNRNMINTKIAETSNLIRNRISDELKQKLFSIMFDVCTKRTFSVLGISATFMHNDEVVARSLGTVQLKERHRGPYMASVVDKTLQNYGSGSSQVVSATADQASNMDNTTRHLSINADGEIMGGDLSDESAYDSASDSEVQMGLENQIELLNELNNDSRYIELVTNMVNDILRKNNLLSSVHKVHCCAHTVQLAVKDAIKKSDANGIIELAREMKKNLRTTVVNIQFRKLAPNCILPPMYIDIRWNSDFQMVIFFVAIFSSIFLLFLCFFISARRIFQTQTCYHRTCK